MEASAGLVTREQYRDSILEIAGMGFQSVELLSDPLQAAFSPEELKAVVADLVEVKKRTKLRFSVHLPFWWDTIAVPEEGLRAASMNNIIGVIRLMEALEPLHYVLHSMKNIPDRVRASQASDAVKRLAFERIRASAEKSVEGIVRVLPAPRFLCIENLEDVNFELDRVLIEEFDTSICLDIGHLFITGGDRREFWERNGRRVRAIHAHNVVAEIGKQPKDWKLSDHRGLSKGLIDYREVLDWLAAEKYEGSFVVEVLKREDALSSIDFLKSRKLL
jgi:sugar phosphate isomerase/epimerase